MAKGKIDFSAMGDRAVNAGKSLAEQDRANENIPWQGSSMAWDRILPRPSGDTRPIDPRHVLAIAESIVAIGLLEPLVVDRQGCLLAGAHRHAAVGLLLIVDLALRQQRFVDMAAAVGHIVTDEDRQRVEDLFDAGSSEPSVEEPLFPGGQVPVRSLDVDAAADPTLALAIEVTENEKRRDYTRSEIQSLAERLKNAGFKASRGRPKAGERALVPALEAIVGKSRATIWRCLGSRDPDAEKVNVSGETFTRTLKRFLAETRRFRVAASGANLDSSVDRAAKALEETLVKASEKLGRKNDRRT